MPAELMDEVRGEGHGLIVPLVSSISFPGQEGGSVLKKRTGFKPVPDLLLS
jgi:hypothetical protein